MLDIGRDVMFNQYKCPGGCVILVKRNKGEKSKERNGRMTEEVGNM